MLSDALPRAALYSDTPVVLDILAQNVNLERQGPFHDTALMLAADRGMPDMVAALLKASANPHAVDNYGRAPCFSARAVAMRKSCGCSWPQV